MPCRRRQRPWANGAERAVAANMTGTATAKPPNSTTYALDESNCYRSSEEGTRSAFQVFVSFARTHGLANGKIPARKWEIGLFPESTGGTEVSPARGAAPPHTHTAGGAVKPVLSLLDVFNNPSQVAKPTMSKPGQAVPHPGTPTWQQPPSPPCRPSPRSFLTFCGAVPTGGRCLRRCHRNHE